MADILYVYKTSIYANLTNKCPCRCTFCIRNNTDSVGSADTLWHKHDRSEEVKLWKRKLHFRLRMKI